MKYLKTFEGLTTPTIEKIVSDIRDMCVELTDVNFMIDIHRDGDNNEIDIRISKGIPRDGVIEMKTYEFVEIYENIEMIIDYLKEYTCDIKFRIDGRNYNKEEYSNYVRRRIDKNHEFHKDIPKISFFSIKIKLEDETSK